MLQVSTIFQPQTVAPSAAGHPHQRQVLDGVGRRLQTSGYHQHRRIAFDLHEGVLTLRGIVSSFFLKQVAQALVADVVGVEEVSNRLEVRYPAASYAT